MCFLQKRFFFHHCHTFNLDIFRVQYYGSVEGVDTLWAQLILQFSADPSENLQVF